jgi:quinol monooxygenase YgiN
MSIARIGEMKARAGEEEALQTFIDTVIVPGVTASPGCEACHVYQSQEEPTRFLIIELWESIEAHKGAVREISAEEINTVKKLLADMPSGAYYTVR